MVQWSLVEGEAEREVRQYNSVSDNIVNLKFFI